MSPDQTSAPQIIVPVSVELADWLWDRLDETVLVPQFENIVGQLLSRLNIPGQPLVSVQASPNDLHPAGFISLRVNDQVCSYSLQTVCWAYLAAGGPQPLDSIAAGRDLSPVLINAGPELLVRFVGYIFQEALSVQPAILLGDAGLVEYERMLRLALRQASRDLPSRDWLRRWLSAALDLNLKLPTPQKAASLLRGWQEKSLPATCEQLIAAQAPQYIELQVERQTWQALSLSYTEEDKDLFKQFHESLFDMLGIELPPIHVTTPPDLPPGTYCLMINHLPSLLHPGLEPDQVLIQAGESELNKLGIPFKPAINPANRGRAAIVTRSVLPSMKSQELTTWNPLSYLVLWLNGVIRERAYYFIALKAAENALKHLGQVFPALESTAKEVVSPERLAPVIRLMLAEGMPVGNLRQIVHSLMDMDFVIAGSDLLVIDERMQVASPPDKTWMEDPAVAVEYVRSNMKYTIMEVFNNRELNLSAYLLDPGIEDLLRNPGVDTQANLETISEATRQGILDAIRIDMDVELRDDGSYPSILTTQDVRPTLRRLLATEFPHLPVLSYQELPTDVAITKLGQITGQTG